MKKRRARIGDRSASIIKSANNETELEGSQNLEKSDHAKFLPDSSPYFSSMIGDLGLKAGLEIQKSDSRVSRLHFDGNSIIIDEKLSQNNEEPAPSRYSKNYRNSYRQGGNEQEEYRRSFGQATQKLNSGFNTDINHRLTRR